jgi:hypothetical protein
MNNYRQNAFKEKFASAAIALGVTSEKIVSLKIRDLVSSYNDYRDLISSLEREFGFQCCPVTGEFQGKGHLLTKEQSKVIVVEHESGLEILYIAGSIASLIGLIPVILQGWKALRQYSNPANPFHQVEVRKLNENGELHEDNVHLNPHGVDDASHLALTVTAGLFEGEFQKLTHRVESISPQIVALEKRIAKVEVALKCAKSSKGKPKRR